MGAEFSSVPLKHAFALSGVCQLLQWAALTLAGTHNQVVLCGVSARETYFHVKASRLQAAR